MIEHPDTVHLVPTPPVDDFDAAEGTLRMQLIVAQQRLGAAGGRLVLDLSGDDRPTCLDALHLLLEWLDPRHVHTHVLGPPRGDEHLYPPFWRYWTRLPRKGDIALFSRAWTMRAVMKTVAREWKKKHLARRIESIERFERGLVDDGVVVLKVWFHAPPDVRKARRAKHGDRKPWRLDDVDEEIAENRKRFRAAALEVLEATSHEHARWHGLVTTDRDATFIAFGTLVLDALTRAAEIVELERREETTLPPAPSSDAPSLATLDRMVSVDRATYDRKLDRLHRDLHDLFEKAARKDVRTVVAFEGGDASGKGGAIRRLVRPIDARDYDVVRIAAPTPEELAHHYLWRFWRQVPRRGQAVVFDRTWYGRVLVERVEGYAEASEWQRAYDEINEFEAELIDDGTVVVKFWLDVSPDVQLARFKAREATPHKRYKITPDDWRNREKRPQHDEAVEDMLARTHTDAAPWTVVCADDKLHARIAVLRTVKNALERAF